MGLRILGLLVSAFLIAFGIARYRRGLLRRGELLAVILVSGALITAALDPDLFNPMLDALGFRRGGARRIIGLLVVSNLFTLVFAIRGFSRDDQVSNEIGELVDTIALNRYREEHPQRSADCAVVMPAFNEAENLPAVLAAIPKKVAGLSTRAIVVADGCTDETEAVARAAGADVVRRDLRRGSGAAVRLGCRAALADGARVIVTLDADGQHDPAELERLVTPLLDDSADITQGSRILGEFEKESRLRSAGVRLFARLLTGLGRTRITDPSTGYRAFSESALGKLDLRQDQFYVSEIILDANRKGLRVVEVPVTIRKRASGSTKKPPALGYAWGFSKAIVRTWFR